MRNRPVVSLRMIDHQCERARLAEAEQDIVDVEIQISFLHLNIERARNNDASTAEANLKLCKLLLLVARLCRERSLLLGAIHRPRGE